MQVAKQRSLADISISDLRRKIQDLKGEDFRVLSAEAMEQRIGSIIDQYMFQPRPLELNAVYRARRNTPGKMFLSAADLWYPPATAVTRASRLNDIGQVRFYGASTLNTAIFELRPKSGDIYTVLLAGTKSSKIERLNVAFIGLERALAPEVQHFGDEDTFRRSSRFRNFLGSENYDKWLLVDNLLSELLGLPVAEGDEHMYKPTIALAKLLFTAPGLDAINYPSVATADHGINICMLPEKADQFFSPFDAWQIRVGDPAVHPQTGEVLHRVEFLRRSSEIRPDGVIEWLQPRERINPEEINRLVRRRVQPLPRWPG